MKTTERSTLQTMSMTDIYERIALAVLVIIGAIVLGMMIGIALSDVILNITETIEQARKLSSM